MYKVPPCLANCSSIVIDFLFASLKFKPVYLYFDYKDDEQTPSKVMACLLAQLVSALPYIPECVETAYKKCNTGQPRPDLSTLVELFRTIAGEFSNVVVFSQVRFDIVVIRFDFHDSSSLQICL